MGTFSPPDLEQIQSPDAAVAETNQRSTLTTIVPPRGVVTRLLPHTPTTIKAPHAQSADYFKEIHNGYMCAQFVQHAAFPTDPLKLWSSESIELEHGGKSPTDAADGSLAPRSVAFWLLGNYGETHCRSLDLLLDSMSIWAALKYQGVRVVNKARMTAIFGNDATYILELAKHELVAPSTMGTAGDAKLMVRWSDGIRTRCVCKTIDQMSSMDTECNALRCVQDTIVKLSGVYDIPIPKICMVPIPLEISVANAFYRNLCDVNNEFFNILLGEPSITFSQETKDKKAFRILQPTGCLVRVCNKMLGQECVTHSSSFHGAILGFAHVKKQVDEFLKTSDEHGLRIPISNFEMKLGLHLCAVQAEGLQLKDLVSLYGTSGVTGKPIHQPGSWVWVARPAVRPLDASLMNVFSIFPCQMTSLLPSRSELVPAFERYWKHTTDIFKMIANGESSYSQDMKAERSSSPSSIYASHLDSNSSSLVTWMNIDFKSERTTLGDTYSKIAHVRGFESIAENIKQAMGCLPNKVRASLYDMFELNGRAVSQYRQSEDSKRKSDECLLRLCETAIEVASNAKRLKTSHDEYQQPQHPALCLSADRVRRILKACMLKGGLYVNIELGIELKTQVIDTLYDVIVASACESAPEDERVVLLTKKPLASIFESEAASPQSWLSTIEAAIGKSASRCMVASGLVNSATFLLVGTMQESEVYVKRVVLDGSVAPSSMDDMCRIQQPRVIIVQQLDAKRIRVTSTVKL